MRTSNGVWLWSGKGGGGGGTVVLFLRNSFNPRWNAVIKAQNGSVFIVAVGSTLRPFFRLSQIFQQLVSVPPPVIELHVAAIPVPRFSILLRHVCHFCFILLRKLTQRNSKQYFSFKGDIFDRFPLSFRGPFWHFCNVLISIKAHCSISTLYCCSSVVHTEWKQNICNYLFNVPLNILCKGHKSQNNTLNTKDITQ